MAYLKQLIGFVVLVVFLAIVGGVEQAASQLGAPGVVAWPVGVIAALVVMIAPALGWNWFRLWRLESKPGVKTWKELDERAFAMHKTGDLAGAQPVYEQALPAAEATRQDLVIATAANNLAGLCVDQERWAEAESLFARAYELRKKAAGRANHLTLKTADRLTNCQAELEHWPQVEAVQREVLAVVRKDSDATEATVETLSAIGVACRHQSKYDKARRAYEEADKLLQRKGEQRSDAAATLYNDWAYLLNATGSPAAALPLYDKAIAIRDRETPTFDLARTLDNRADAQTALHDLSGAAATSQRWFELMDGILSAGGAKQQPALVLLIEQHARRLEAAGRTDEADRLRARAAAVREENPDEVAKLEKQIAGM